MLSYDYYLSQFSLLSVTPPENRAKVYQITNRSATRK
jgi:hypothetical protein